MDNNKYNQLVEQRNKVVEDLKKIKADVEKGQWNDTIDREFNSLSDDFNKITVQIELEKRPSGIENEIERKVSMQKEERPGPEIRSTNGDTARVYRAGEKMTAAPYIVGVGQYFRTYLTGAKNEFEERSLAAGTSSAGGILAPGRLINQIID
jgi:HK97 family phage major capsid protein